MEDVIFEDDPVLGKFIANYPSNRLRLLLIGGAILFVVWFFFTVLLWRVEAGLAAAITVAIVSLTTLVVGWALGHFWNREIIVYEKGFSLREGSRFVYIHFENVTSIHQKIERRVFFGGLVHRTYTHVVLKTEEDETILLNSVYSKAPQAAAQLEYRTTQARMPIIGAALQNGGQIAFGEGLTAAEDGLYFNQSHLPWDEFAGYEIANRRLYIYQHQASTWLEGELTQFDNLRLFIEILRQHQTSTEAEA